MISLSKEQVVAMHIKLMEATAESITIINEAGLDSALLSPLQIFFGKELYPGNIRKIARTIYGIIKNHPFLDGNKRTGTYVMLVLLKLNGVEAKLSKDDVVYVGEAVANGAMNDRELAAFIYDKLN